MSEIAPEAIDRMMVKCGRRCCICRRFRPTKLQAHHIIERNQGGTDDEDYGGPHCLDQKMAILSYTLFRPS